MSAAQAQESIYTEDFDYIQGSPHLKHRSLYSNFIEIILDAISSLQNRSRTPIQILDIGAGEGSFTGPMLAYGARVTAVEMSQGAVSRLDRLFGRNEAFDVIHDPDGNLEQLGSRRYDMILYASVLHHIPDYFAAIDVAITKHLTTNGTLLCLQDPLWYPSQPRLTRVIDQIAYLSWRITKGQLSQGFRTRYRRLRKVWDEANPSDMTEYHVVRQGVDQDGLVRELRGHFREVDVLSYWSTQSSIWQGIGKRLGLTNTFAIVATGYSGKSENRSTPNAEVSRQGGRKSKEAPAS